MTVLFCAGIFRFVLFFFKESAEVRKGHRTSEEIALYAFALESFDNFKLILSDGRKIGYDRLLIATGANSFIPPIREMRTANNVFGLRHLSDARAIRRLAEQASKVLIVGSGLVGMDVAYAFLEQKKEVTVIEMMDRILPIQLNEKAGKVYKEQFEAHGCQFILGGKVMDTHKNSEGAIDAVFFRRWNQTGL